MKRQGWKSWKRGKVLAYLVLLALAVPTLWVGGREYIKLFNVLDTPGKERDKERGEERPVKEVLIDLAETARIRAVVDRDRADWRLGDMVRKGEPGTASAFYEASVVNSSGQEVFRLKISSAGVPFSGDRGRASAPAVDEDHLKGLMPSVLNSLVTGEVRATGKERQGREVGLRYNGTEVAVVKVASGKHMVETRKPKQEKGKRLGWLFDEEQMRWTGWVATAALFLSVLHWPLKRMRFFAPERPK